MERDKLVGACLLAAAVVIAVVYTWAMFFAGEAIQRWALIIPVYLAMIAILGIAGYIGYTMITTPSPEELIKELEEGEKREETGEKEQKPAEEGKETPG